MPGAAVQPSPSASLLGHLEAQLRLHAPFKHMAPDSLHALLAAARQSYFAPGEVICSPAAGVASCVWWVRQGQVRGVGPGAGLGARPQEASGGAAAEPGFQIEAGEMFPLGAVLGRRAVTSVYRAHDDVFCLHFDAATFARVVQADPVLADFVRSRLQHLLALSQAALQSALEASGQPGFTPASGAQALTQQSLEMPLSSLARRAPVAVAPDATLHEALLLMNERSVGSVLAMDAQGLPLGILTRHDLLPRVVLADPPINARHTPLRAVMSAPVHTLDIGQPLQQAALLMSRHGIRHVPLTEDGRVVSLVSERDLFALQRRSLRQLGQALRAAPDLATLRALAPELPALARQLLAQAVAARTLTQLVSHLNDALVARVVGLLAAQHGLDLARACWVAFGSEGRGEQTIATDQDNGLVLDDAVGPAERESWRAMARQVNQALDDCGFPLCKGGIMAGEAACTQTRSAWAAAFSGWMAHGQPQDLLKAAIFFDLRPIAGNAGLAGPLRRLICEQAPGQPRFLRLLAVQSLSFRPALNWHGGLDAVPVGGRSVMDLKLHGTAVFVDAARCLALAQGQAAVGTRERLLGAGQAMGVPVSEREGWAAAFEVLQLLRLRAQVGPAPGLPPGAASRAQPAWGTGNPNHIDLDSLNDLDRRLLREALRAARRLQQRLEMDWARV
jgi:CBS domain-containing protein